MRFLWGHGFRSDNVGSVFFFLRRQGETPHLSFSPTFEALTFISTIVDRKNTNRREKPPFFYSPRQGETTLISSFTTAGRGTTLFFIHYWLRSPAFLSISARRVYFFRSVFCIQCSQFFQHSFFQHSSGARSLIFFDQGGASCPTFLSPQ